MTRAELRRRVAALACLATTASAAAVVTGCRSVDSDSEPAPSATRAAVLAPPVAAPPAVSVATVPPLSPGAKVEDEQNTVAVFQQAAPSTVFVTQHQMVIDHFAGRARQVESGSGSGFVWDRQGHVVTNWHVVRNAKRLTVTLHDHKTYEAKLVGSEPRKDIAVLRIRAPEQSLVPIQKVPLRTALAVGQKAIAIGNPFGLDHTLTTGVVSALGREVPGAAGVSIRGMVQTDAAINPGNSGGPLLNSAGQLIGMNTVIMSRSGAWAGIGFAVPASTVMRVVPQLIEHGRVRQVGLGIRIDPQGRLEKLNRIRGVVVISVRPDSPGAEAGLRGLRQTSHGIALGDVIIGVDEERIADYDDLYNALDGRAPHEKAKVRVKRGKDVVEVELPLAVIE